MQGISLFNAKSRRVFFLFFLSTHARWHAGVSNLIPLHANSFSIHVQVMQLQTTSASPQSPPVDYGSGTEAMVLAILQQADYSLLSELVDMAGLALHLSQDELVQHGLLLNAYSSFLADALASNAMLETSLQRRTSAASLIPASHPFAKPGHKWHCLPAFQ